MDARAPNAADPPARRALLRAALPVFAAHGFEGSGTRAIAAAAGVNQGLIRHHFGSKEGLWRELIERGLDALLRALELAGPAALAGEANDAGAHLALLHVIVHALLEPGPRRDWLVRGQLEPLRRRTQARARPSRPLDSSVPPNDAQLLAWLGGALAPWLFAPALAAATGRAIALDATARAAAGAGPWSRPAVARAVGPWAPGGRAAGSTPTGAS